MIPPGIRVPARGTPTIYVIRHVRLLVIVYSRATPCGWPAAALSLPCRWSAAGLRRPAAGLPLPCRWSAAGLPPACVGLPPACRCPVAALPLVCRWSVAALSLICRWSVAGLSGPGTDDDETIQKRSNIFRESNFLSFDYLGQRF